MRVMVEIRIDDEERFGQSVAHSQAMTLVVVRSPHGVEALTATVASMTRAARDSIESQLDSRYPTGQLTPSG